MPLGLRIMELGLELNNLTIPFYLIKILTGHTLYMVMSTKSFLMTCQIHFVEAVTTTTTMDANLNHCLATGKSLTGCLHFVNKTPVDCILRNKPQWRQLPMVQSLLLPNSNRTDHGH